jgi:lipoprotein Spr
MDRQDEIIARARACIGARFRAQGRDPALGLDCVGLAAVAFAREAGAARYALRGGDAQALGGLIVASGLVPLLPGAAGPGDLVMADAGMGQLHLVVLTGTGFVHADAGLRRVVERPGVLPWPAVAAWREGEN